MAPRPCPAATRRLAAVAAAAFAAALAAAQSDSQCGNATEALAAGKRNVLLVGDSISMSDPYTPGGYGVPLRALLEGAGVAVQHAGGFYGGGQCSNTVKGLLCTNASTPNNYIAIPGGGVFDVVHANWGLHDLVAACPSPNVTGECQEHVDLVDGVYGENLVELYKRFSPVTKSFIWVSTTPVPNVTTSMGRTYELAVAYNNQALEYLSALSGNLIVDDLWGAFIASCGAYYTSCEEGRKKGAAVHDRLGGPRGRAFFALLVGVDSYRVPANLPARPPAYASRRRAHPSLRRAAGPLQLPANVHLTKAGETFAAQHAFASIMAAIAQLEARGE